MNVASNSKTCVIVLSLLCFLLCPALSVMGEEPKKVTARYYTETTQGGFVQWSLALDQDEGRGAWMKQAKMVAPDLQVEAEGQKLVWMPLFSTGANPALLTDSMTGRGLAVCLGGEPHCILREFSGPFNFENPLGVTEIILSELFLETGIKEKSIPFIYPRAEETDNGTDAEWGSMPDRDVLIGHPFFDRKMRSRRIVFSIAVEVAAARGAFSVPLHSFSWNPESGCYEFTKDLFIVNAHPLRERSKLQSPMIAILRDVVVRIDMRQPEYELEYSYKIELMDSHEEFGMITVYLNRLHIPLGEYRARAFTLETLHDSLRDSDSQAVKQAANLYDPVPGYPSNGDPYPSMVYFLASSETFTRGYLDLSCGGNGCGGTFFIEWPVPPDFFDVPGEINEFSIESQWRGTTGDLFESHQQFIVTPQ